MNFKYIILTMALVVINCGFNYLSAQQNFCNYTQNSQNATIVFPAELSILANETPLDSGSVISAIVMRSDTMVCVGSVIYEGGATAMTIYGSEGDDPGLNVNESFQLVAQLPAGCVTFASHVEYLSGSIYDADSTYKVNGISGFSALEFNNTLKVSVNIKNESAGGSNGRIELIPSGGIAPYSYKWSDKSLGESAVVDGLSAGSYQVIVSDRYGCNELLTIQVDLGTSFDIQKASAKKVSMYVNHQGEVVLEFNDLLNPEAKVSIYSINGQLIHSQEIQVIEDNLQVIVNPHNPVAGLYVAHLDIGGYSFIEKLFLRR